MRRPRAVFAVLGGVSLAIAAFNLAGCPPTGTNVGGQTLGFNLPPNVVLAVDVDRGIAPLTVRFDSGASTDDGLIVDRQWNFGDGQTSREIAPTHTFITTGEYNVTLTVTDDVGARTTRSRTISVTLAPVARINVDRTVAETAPAVFNFDGSASFDPDGEIDEFAWDFGDGSGEVQPVVPHTFGRPGTYRVTLTVTDNTGVTSESEIVIQVGIPKPTIRFRSPPADVTNLVLSNDSLLWSYIVFSAEPNVPRTLRGGLDRDRDACDANASVFDAGSGQILRQLLGHDEPVTSVAFAPNNQHVLTGSSDRTAQVYDVDTGISLLTIGGHTDGINAVGYSKDGSQLVTAGADGLAVLHRASDGADLRTINAGRSLAAVAISPTGELIATGGDVANDPNTPAEAQPLAVLWDASTGVSFTSLIGHTGKVTSVAFSSDGVRLATGSVDKTARIWDVASGVELVRLIGHTNSINGVAYFGNSTGGQVATASSDLTVRLWEASTGAQLRVFSGHTDRVTSVAFSSDGKQLITGAADGTLRIWDVNTGAQVRSMSACTSAVNSVAMSADSSHVVAGYASRSSIQLDVAAEANGNDLNLGEPLGLSLKGVPTGTYSFWSEIDTDRTDPVRTYSHVSVQIVPPFTQVIEAETPEVVYGSDNSAEVIVAPTTERQIFSLGHLTEGTRLHLALLAVPGYDRYFEEDRPFSVLILDDTADPNDPAVLKPEMFVWYQEGFHLLTRESKIVIGHDATYYVVIDGLQGTFGNSNGVNLSVRKEPGFGTVKRRQTVFLNFNGGTAISINRGAPTNVAPFDASDVNSSWGPAETAILKQEILETVREIYVNESGVPFDIEFVSSDDTPSLPQPHSTVYFGGFNIIALFAFGVADYIDPRNDTLTGNAIVFTDGLGDDFYPSETPQTVGEIIGRITAHEIGHLLGLRHTDATGDVMSSEDPITPESFMNSPITGREQYNAQIGNQNAPRYLEELLGLRP